MRGKAYWCWSMVQVDRITPAHAGKSACYFPENSVYEDHPRACGEKGPIAALFLEHSGITPAHAGKRCSSQFPRCRTWDHPRACGEKRVAFSPRIVRVGSPPRMRGKVWRAPSAIQHNGITPAHAGKSCRKQPVHIAAGDHPRTRGEKGAMCATGAAASGSPPHTRGKD